MNLSLNKSCPIIYGEVLYDVFPDGMKVLGGAPFNVAWHCHAFGLNPILLSRVGNDELGIRIRNAMKKWGMDTRGLQLDSGHSTGVVNVRFNHGEPSYDIVKDSAWEFINYDSIIDSVPDILNNKFIYHGSLVTRNPVAANTLTLLKKSIPSVFVDINLRSPWWGLGNIHEMLNQARWIKLNVDELALIIPDNKDIQSASEYLLSEKSADLVILTKGSDGANALTLNKLYTIKPGELVNVVDTVGAGDAFSSIIITGLHYDWPLQTILDRAQVFASSVVAQQGATTEDKNFYEPFITEWGL